MSEPDFTKMRQGKTIRFTRLPEGDSFRETHLSLQIDGEESPFTVEVEYLAKLLRGELPRPSGGIANTISQTQFHLEGEDHAE